MILGYRAFSAIFRRFRFAEEWNVRSSTVDVAQLTADLVAHGFALRATYEVDGHVILHCTRGSG
jgi:hypothetical protein